MTRSRSTAVLWAVVFVLCSTSWIARNADIRFISLLADDAFETETLASLSAGAVAETMISLSPSPSSLATVNPSSPLNVSSTAARDIYFYHVGKAGGESIKHVLDIGCRAFRNKARRNNCYAALPDSRLSELVVGYMHCFQSVHRDKDSRLELLSAESSSDRQPNFLLNLRHPVDRVTSWYYYVHPGYCQKSTLINCHTRNAINANPGGWEDRFFTHCFPTFQDWATAVSTTKLTGSDSDTNNCTILAREALAGDIDFKSVNMAAHLVANMAKLSELSIGRFPEAGMWIVRTDRLWDDLQSIDRAVGGSGDDFGDLIGTKVTHGSEKHGANRTSLLPTNSIDFCCALRSEMVSYVDLLQRAMNLDGDEKRATIQATAGRCGMDSWQGFLEQCPASGGLR